MQKEKVRSLIHWPELFCTLFFLAIAAGIVIFSRELDMLIDGTPGPRFVPIVLSVIIVFLSIIYYIEILVNPAKRIQFPDFKKLSKPATFVGISLLIVLLWEPLGAVITVFAVGLLELKFMEQMTWKRSARIAIVFSLVTWIVFQYVLDIQLPPGLLGILLDL